MKIDAIIYPYVYTNSGNRIHVNQFIGKQPQIGDIVQANLDDYEAIPQGEVSCEVWGNK